MPTTHGFSILKKVLRGTVLLLIFCLLLAGTGPGAYAQARNAQNDTGFTKVIVQLKIPGLKGLTNESRKHKAIWPGKSFNAKGLQADEKLEKAIQRVTDDVLFKLNGTAYKLNRRYVSLPYMAMDVSPEAMEKMRKMPEVLDIDTDVPRKRRGKGNGANGAASQTTEERKLSSPTLLNNTASLIGADNVWNMGFTGAGWFVAVVDCGMLTTHEMFAGKTIYEKCYSVESECPNGLTEMYAPGAAVQQGVDCSYYPDDYSNHGTWTTAVATGSSASLTGIAPDADILAIQVCSVDTPSDCILDYASDVTSALDFVYASRGCLPIAAVNLSIGYDPTDSEQITPGGITLMTAAIDNLRAVGIPVIAATGNRSKCNEILFPAMDDGTIAVGASTDSDIRWVDHSSYGSDYSSAQNLFAPGKSIYTANGTGTTAYYTAPNGTSMAAPHVTGAWTLIKQAWPAASVDDIIAAFENTGLNINACSGSSPRIRVDDALDSVRYISLVRPYGTESVPRGGSITISWNTGPAVSGDVTLVAVSQDVSYFIEMTHPYNGSPYTWTIPANFPLYSQTKIQVRQGSLYGESQPFSVGGIDVTSPTAGRTWRSGNTYTISWTSQGLDGNIRIYALEQPHTATPYPKASNSSYFAGINITTSYPVSAGSYSWTIPQSTDSGSYKIEIRQDKVKGYSPVFNILGDIIFEIPDKVID